jgi:hypothetical protein
MNTQLTRENVMTKFNRDDRFAVSLLVEMYYRQTADEQANATTSASNGIGFNGTDANFLTSLAEQATAKRNERYCGLTERQLGAMRKAMQKYGRQLAEITNERIALREAEGNWTLRGPVSLPRFGDFGNDEGLVANEEYAARQSDTNPYGEGVPTYYTPLPDHLKAKAAARREEIAKKAAADGCGGKFGWWIDGRHDEDMDWVDCPGCPDCQETEEVSPTGSPFPAALVAIDGGWRWKTAKEQWVDGERETFNANVERWLRDREGVVVGGSPAEVLVGDPFA